MHRYGSEKTTTKEGKNAYMKMYMRDYRKQIHNDRELYLALLVFENRMLKEEVNKNG